jgi:hypothetical protein
MSKVANPTIAINLTLTLPDSVAREAKDSGLLTAQSLEALLRDELRRRRVNQLFAVADRLAALELPPLTEAEVDAEIQAVRAARHVTNANCS